MSAATVGAVLAGRRPRHPVGWLLLGLGLWFAYGYASWVLLAWRGAPPAVGCTGSGQDIVVRVPASAGKTFKQGIAVATAEISGCGTRVCGSETDSETIDIQR